MLCTPLFVVLLSGGLMLGLASLLSESFLPFLLAYDAVLAVLWIVDALTIPGASALRMRRHLPDALSHGIPQRVDMSVTNLGRRMLKLELRDSPPSSFSVSVTRLKLRVPVGHRSSQFYEVKPTQRGEAEFGSIYCRISGRLGLALRQYVYAASREVTVYPDLSAVSRRDYLSAPSVHRLEGFRRHRIVGEGFEFERLRDMVPGDDSRRIDWKATAKRRKLTVKQYQPERNQHVLIALDCGRVMSSPAGEFTKLDWAVNAALYLAYVAAIHDDYVGLMIMDERGRSFTPPVRGRKQLRRISEMLQAVETSFLETDYSAAFTTMLKTLHQRTLVVMFSDVVDPDISRDLLHHLARLAPRHLPLCVTVEDEELREAIARFPRRPDDVFQRVAALELEEDTARAVALLRRRGGLALRVPPGALSLATVEKYLDIKTRGLL